MGAENESGTISGESRSETAATGTETAGGTEEKAESGKLTAETSKTAHGSEEKATPAKTEEAEPEPEQVVLGRRRKKVAAGVDDYMAKLEAAKAPLPDRVKEPDGSHATGSSETDEQGEKPAKAVAAAPVGKDEEKPAAERVEAKAEETEESRKSAERSRDEDDTKLPDRMRLGGLSETDKAHLVAAKAISVAEKIPLADALLRVAGKTTQRSDASTGEATTTAAADPNARTVEKIQGEIDALDLELETAATNLDTAAMAKLTKDARKLERELSDTKRANERAEEKAQTKAERDFEAKLTTFKQQTVSIYPDAAVKESALEKEMIKIADLMEEQGNPLPSQPEGVLKIAQMAANNLGIAPRDPTAKAEAVVKKESSTPAAAESRPATATKPPAKNQSAVLPKPAVTGTAAAGSARTAGGNGTINGVDLDKKSRSPEEYNEKLTGIGLRPVEA